MVLINGKNIGFTLCADNKWQVIGRADKTENTQLYFHANQAKDLKYKKIYMT